MRAEEEINVLNVLLDALKDNRCRESAGYNGSCFSAVSLKGLVEVLTERREALRTIQRALRGEP